MGEERWRQLRDLFDAVCDLPPETWDEELARRTRDPALIRETLELLRSQTVALERARAPLDGLLTRMAAPELKPGDMLGPWRLGERLGAGGMGVVYRAERADGLYERKVAVKLLHGLPDARSAEREARVAEQVGQFMLGVFEASDPRRTGRGGDEVSVRELLDAGAARIAALADTPEVHARVQQLMGQAYANIGQPARAEQLLREAAGALQSPQVRQPVRAAAALNDLATLLANEGRGREAEEAARRSLALLEAAGE